MQPPQKTIRETLFNFFIWVSGSDPSILKRCDRYEHIKHAGFGALILIPTTMALISMPFAISMLGVSFTYCLISGVIWASMVFAIDRSMVSSMKKGSDEIRSSLGSLALRIIFAAALGITISDPLVLRLFEPTINETLTINEKGKRLALKNQYKTLLLKEETRIDSFRSQVIKPAEGKRDVFLQLYQWEKNAQKKTIIYDGIEYTTSGFGSIGERAKKYESAYDKEDEIVSQLYAKLTRFQEQIDSNIVRISLDELDELGNLNNAMSRDYLTRAKYLHELAEKDSSIWARKWFLIVFLIFVDIIPVLFKSILRPSQYDFWVNNSELATLKVVEHFYEKDRQDKEFFVDSVSDFRKKEMTRIFSEDNEDKRSLGERLDELERLTNLKWGG